MVPLQVALLWIGFGRGDRSEGVAETFDVIFRLEDVLFAADVEGSALMNLVGNNVDDRFHSVASPSSGLLGQKAQRTGLIEEA